MTKVTDNPLQVKIYNIKAKCNKQNIPFDLTLEDLVVPDRCPVLGFPIKFNKGRQQYDSISVDRIIPDLGYVRGNIIIVSHRANMIKNNSTIDELITVAKFYKDLCYG